MKKTIKRREEDRPTKRQLDNIQKITDPEKKKKRLDAIASNEEKIQLLQKDLSEMERRYEQEMFDFDDKMSRLEKYRVQKFEISLFSIALIYFV